MLPDPLEPDVRAIAERARDEIVLLYAAAGCDPRPALRLAADVLRDAARPKGSVVELGAAADRNPVS